MPDALGDAQECTGGSFEFQAVGKSFQTLTLRVLQMELKQPCVDEDTEPKELKVLVEALPAASCSGTSLLSNLSRRPRIKALQKS